MRVGHWYWVVNAEDTTAEPFPFWVREKDDDLYLNNLDYVWYQIPHRWRIVKEIVKNSSLVRLSKEQFYKRTIKVVIRPDRITIKWDNNEIQYLEVARWTKDEWMENPMVCVEIANAIRLACVEPETLLAMFNVQYTL
jgi:hypothetical protein